jgi:hypothetical protein
MLAAQLQRERIGPRVIPIARDELLEAPSNPAKSLADLRRPEESSTTLRAIASGRGFPVAPSPRASRRLSTTWIAGKEFWPAP